LRVALHTRVRGDKIGEYERAHAAVPPELTDAIRAAGVSAWTIWRSGTELFHLIECDDYGAMLAQLSSLPVNIAWQARMADLLETAHDYSAAGGDAALAVVWQL
jgi:L-rhamnose mutarotase